MLREELAVHAVSPGMVGGEDVYKRQEYPHCHLHVDATQAVGKIPVSFEGVDLSLIHIYKPCPQFFIIARFWPKSSPYWPEDS